MPSDDFSTRRARQLMNGASPVAVNGPLATITPQRNVYGVSRGPDNSVVYQFGDVRFVLARDDAIKLGMLSLKYAGCEVDYGDQEQAGEADPPVDGSNEPDPAG